MSQRAGKRGWGPGGAPPWAADQVPSKAQKVPAGRDRGRSRRAPASAFPPARRPGRRGGPPWVMAGGAAPRGAELLAFARFRESSKRPLAYGYGSRGLQELREREFGRLAGEAGGAPVWGWERWCSGTDGERALALGENTSPCLGYILDRKTWRDVCTRPLGGPSSLRSHLQPKISCYSSSLDFPVEQDQPAPYSPALALCGPGLVIFFPRGCHETSGSKGLTGAGLAKCTNVQRS